MFCSNCGKEISGMGKFCEHCGSAVGNDGNNRAQFQQQQTQGNNDGMTREAEWFNEKKKILVSSTRNMFAEILPIFKMPVTRIQTISASENPAVGLEFVATKAVLSILSTLLMFKYLEENIRMLDRIISDSHLKIIVMVLFMTLGMDCLKAFLLKITTGVLNGRTSFSKMITVVGARALYEGIIFLVSCLFLFFAPEIALFLLVLGMMIFPYIEYSGYMSVAQVNSDRKPYIYFAVKVCMSILMIILLRIFAAEFIDGFFDELLYWWF